MNDPDIQTGAVTLDEMAAMDWGEEFQPSNHAIKFKVDQAAQIVSDLKTGDILAKVEPGYRWYWFHSHLHIRPDSYTLNAEEQNDLRMQGHEDAKERGKASVLMRVGKAIGYLSSALEKCEPWQHETILMAKEATESTMIQLKTEGEMKQWP
jgi:hypothetical protein